jgi:hypothetical protein
VSDHNSELEKLIKEKKRYYRALKTGQMDVVKIKETLSLFLTNIVPLLTKAENNLANALRTEEDRKKCAKNLKRKFTEEAGDNIFNALRTEEDRKKCAKNLKRKFTEEAAGDNIFNALRTEEDRKKCAKNLKRKFTEEEQEEILYWKD